MALNIRPSYDSFRALRENNSYYIDKTQMLEEYLVRRFDKVVLFTRPRRFGKTVTMTMFRDFLDIRQDSKEIFKDLKIMDSADVVDKFMNQYPVVFFSLKEVFGEDYGSILDRLQNVASSVCKQNAWLLDSEKVDEADKELLNTLRFRKRKENAVEVLDLLSRMLFDHYGKPVFIIIDEYDVPMAKALGTPVYDKVRDMIEQMLSYVCKTNDHVMAVLLYEIAAR